MFDVEMDFLTNCTSNFIQNTDILITFGNMSAKIEFLKIQAFFFTIIYVLVKALR